jgi:hypothetical protein
MLRTALQCAACAVAFGISIGVTSAASVYQDPEGEFRIPLPDGWTVERPPMSNEMCELTATDIKSSRDPISQFNVRACAVELDPASLRQGYDDPRARGDLQREIYLLAYKHENMRRAQTLYDLEAKSMRLHQQLQELATLKAEQADQAKLQGIEQGIEAELREIDAQLRSPPPAPDDPAYATQIQKLLLEETCRPLFRGFMAALGKAGRVETSGKVTRTTALGRNAMRNDFMFYPNKDGKPRKGFMIYLFGDRTAYVFMAIGDEHEYPVVAQMFEGIEVLR